MSDIKSLRILVADDHEIVRAGLRAILAAEPGWEIVAEAGNGRDAVSEAIRLQPDIAVLDISMPELNGLEATRQMLEAVPRLQVLILTLNDSEDLVRQVLAAGARGYVLKSDSSRDLVSAIDSLSKQRPFLTQKVSEMVLASFTRAAVSPRGGDEPTNRLSPREREIAQLLAEGRGNKEIAALLKISVKTVETHRANLMGKLNLHSMNELVRYAIRNKIIES